MAFVVPLVLNPPAPRRLTTNSSSKRRRPHSVFALSQSDWLHTSDTLRGFEALCERAQSKFCSAAAAIDGLGTFENLPHSYDSFQHQLLNKNVNDQPCRSMKGGRNFEQAVVSVWRAPTSISTPTRRRSNRNGSRTDGVGLSLRLQPRDSRLPVLRANVHYFQLSSGRCTTWWFSGAADLSLGKAASPNSFANDSRVFLNQFRQPLATHRRERLTDAAFLDACLFEEEKSDRLAAFAFAGDVVELLLPAYLPLVQNDYQPPSSRRNNNTSFDPDGNGNNSSNIEVEGFERFGLDGGASCESQVTQMAPFAWWTFTVAPRNSSPEGRRFKAMRKGVQPPSYM